MTYDEIVAALRLEALNERATGWLSDMGDFELEWDASNQAISVSDRGSIDVGHLASIVHGILSEGEPQ